MSKDFKYMLDRGIDKKTSDGKADCGCAVQLLFNAESANPNSGVYVKGYDTHSNKIAVWLIREPRERDILLATITPESVTFGKLIKTELEEAKENG